MQEPVEVSEPSRRPSLKVVRARPRGSSDIRAYVRTQWRLLMVVGTLALGILSVSMGWYGAAHTNIITEQIPYLISGGLLGLGLIILSGVMAYAFMVERGNEALRRDIARALSEPRAHATDAEVTPRAAVAADEVFVVPGGRSYHLAGCPIIEGKDGARALAPVKAMSSGLAPCKLCHID